ncbi:hypothetical protein HMPREF0044_0090 [Gleimia coleocanis DSM 15436]|uniref:Uncharacterized protein n=1 Tax=Gleimia coleocanis DSM 15436 TaxID=525245 RepID=C0VY50_9ACTO|nr:hypothetical protein [Gleimia coleocanis]EEH64353.1 hypothetical protein HMPREF0044_0090 [Gleimia coleocanis DSM 15436]
MDLLRRIIAMLIVFGLAIASPYGIERWIRYMLTPVIFALLFYSPTTLKDPKTRGMPMLLRFIAGVITFLMSFLAYFELTSIVQIPFAVIFSVLIFAPVKSEADEKAEAESAKQASHAGLSS